MVLSGEPTRNDIRVDVVDGLEFVIGREAGAELDCETMSGWEEQDGGDVGDMMLLKDFAYCDTFGCMMEGVFGVWEGGDFIDENGIIVVIVGSDNIASGSEVSAQGILADGDTSLVSRHVVDESTSVE